MGERTGSLLTFEMDINGKSEKITKSVSFKADIKNDDEEVEEDTNDNLFEYIKLLAKRFGKVMRILDRRSRNNFTTNVKYNLPPNSKGFSPPTQGWRMR